MMLAEETWRISGWSNWRLATLAIPAWLVFAASACGSSDNPNTGDPSALDCSFSECGGDVAGSWRVRKLCAQPVKDPDPSIPCKGVQMEVLPEVDMTVTFSPDGKVTRHTTKPPTLRLTVSDTCLSMITILNKTCADIPSLTKVTGAKATCTGDVKSSCVCEIVPENTQPDATGSYKISGNMMELDFGDGEPTSAPFCVSGATMRAKIATSSGFSAPVPFSSQGAAPMTMIQVAVRN